MVAGSDSAGSRSARALGIGLALALTIALPLGGGCLCNNTDPPPTSRECEAGSAVTITALELGAPTGTFTPGAHADQVRGGQGLSMLSFRIAVQSAGEPTCIDQRTEAGPTIFGRPLLIASHEGDWWVTAPLYVITSSVSIPVSTTSGGLSVTRTMSIALPADSGADAP